MGALQLVGELPEKGHSTVRREISAAHKWNENSYTCGGPTTCWIVLGQALSCFPALIWQVAKLYPRELEKYFTPLHYYTSRSFIEWGNDDSLAGGRGGESAIKLVFATYFEFNYGCWKCAYRRIYYFNVGF